MQACSQSLWLAEYVHMELFNMKGRTVGLKSNIILGDWFVCGIFVSSLHTQHGSIHYDAAMIDEVVGLSAYSTQRYIYINHIAFRWKICKFILREGKQSYLCVYEAVCHKIIIMRLIAYGIDPLLVLDNSIYASYWRKRIWQSESISALWLDLLDQCHICAYYSSYEGNDALCRKAAHTLDKRRRKSSCTRFTCHT